MRYAAGIGCAILLIPFALIAGVAIAAFLFGKVVHLV